MSVKVHVDYLGDLRCMAHHGPSGDSFPTDAPVDNHGKGEHFSPTDLLGTAIASCMLTIMGIAAKQHGWDISGSTADAEKTMSADPVRHISHLAVKIKVKGGPFDPRAQKILRAAAEGCPVHASLGERTKVDLEMEFSDS